MTTSKRLSLPTLAILLGMQISTAAVPKYEKARLFINPLSFPLNKPSTSGSKEYSYFRKALSGLNKSFTNLISLRSNSMDSKVNKSRRNLLLSTGAVGVIGAGFVSVPFLKSWLPSERAKAFAGPVKANISKLEKGQMLSVIWRGQPIFIVNRTGKQTQVLDSLNGRLKDPLSRSSIQPKSIKGLYRSKKDSLLVVIGICTHLGCVPKYYPDLVPQQFDKEWKGGFFCPCHSSMFDISGRVFKGSPAGRNLDIPAHVYLDDHTIEIGINEEQA